MSVLDDAIALRKAGKVQESLPLLEQALREDPFNPLAWKHAGFTAIELKQFKFAASMLESYARSSPKDPFGHFNLGYARWRLGDYVGCRVATERAAALAPEFVKAQIALGYLGYMLGDPEAGRTHHDRALELNATPDDGLLESGIVRVLRGEFEEGWRIFEDSRWKSCDWKRPAWHVEADRRGVLWKGEDIRDRTLYVYGEGGFGDTLMFCRFAAPLRGRTARTVIVTDRPLHRIVGTAKGVDACITEQEADFSDPLAYHVSAWSLPALLGTSHETLSVELPYLTPPDEGPILEATPNLRVGLAWAGNPELPHDPDRTCPDIALLAPLFEVPGVDWFSFQFGVRVEDTARTPARPAPEVKDFADTAFALKQLDLVISVDTSLVHVAGAVGVPAWVMVPTYREFRWMLDGDTTPWYPSFRIFRRHHTGEWAGMVQRVAAALHEEVQRRAASRVSTA
jgi:tetratricopeptide (TPR) repeat protein